MKKIVLCGIQNQGIDIINFLCENNIQVTNIVTISWEIAVKNNSHGTWVSYEKISKKHNIPIYYAKSYSLNNQEDIEYFKQNKFDILLLGGWQRLLSQTILSSIKFPIGQHGSSEFLPKGRGRSPINWCIINNKKRLIWNLFLLDDNVDGGEVLDYSIFQIRNSDTCKTIYYKVSCCVKFMLLRTIPKLLNGEIKFIKQVGEPTYYKKRTPEDGYISFDKSVFDIHNLIRAVTKPYPGAFVKYKGTKISVWTSQVFDEMIDFYKDSKNGEIVEIFDDDNYVIKCYDGLLLITESEDNNLFIGKKYD